MRFNGKVTRGKREGSKIGFQTANISVNHNMQPGIYTGFAALEENNQNVSTDLKALFYIPETNTSLVECHILDFPKKDLYDIEMSVEILHKLRDVQEFTGLKAASEQIKKDELKARQWFKNEANK